jgi:hypothetical protein
MARAVANVVVSTDTFASWVGRTNQLADAMSLYAVTVESNTVGAGVTGNGFVNGILSANTFAAGDILRGGSVATSANLNITSNTRVTGAVLYSTANLDIQVANASVNSTILYISGGLANVTSNVSVVTTNTSIQAANTSLKGGNVHITSNTQVNAANVVINGTITTLSGTTLSITSNTDLVATTLNANAVVTVNGNTTVTANSITLKANSSLSTFSISGNGTVSNTTISGNTFTVVGNAFFSNTVSIAQTLDVTGAVTHSNTIAVTGNATFSNVSTFTGLATIATANIAFANVLTANVVNLNVSNSINLSANLSVVGTSSLSGNVTIQNNYVIVVTSNTNIGANVSAAQNVFTFSTASFSSAKITAQIKTLAGTNTQINEIVLAHDTITPFLTVYGTVSSPLGSNLGVFTTAINTGVVSLKFLQNTANSNVTLVAHLIK